MNSIKRKIAAREFIRQGFNGAGTIRAIEPEGKLTKGSIEVKASRMLRDDKFIQSVEEELEAHGITSE